jgi:amino acid adenylation domain-containing protein/non-ribosomal peptide synthase protein (TIGR01720 family)
MSDPNQKVCNVSLFGSLSEHRLRQYNQTEASPIEQFVDRLIEERCLSQPSALAVNAWDGDFTYSQIHELSSHVAAELQSRGVSPNQFVPLCFEKSRWTAVALLGVLKAGAAFMLLDPNHPVERLQEICREAGVVLVLTSKSKQSLAASLAPDTFIVNEKIATWKPQSGFTKGQNRDPSDAVFSVFTSGSTGKPKGVVIEHTALATSAIAHGNALLMDTNSRVLQFASYAFDVAVMEHVTTLLMGGCICIPSDVQRQDIAKSVATYRSNWAFLTPSVARVLDPSDFKTLRTLVSGGESITAKELSAWRSHVNFFLAYGPSECSIMCSAQLVSKDINDSRNLGHCFGSSGWVVSPNDPSQLLPLGAVGELLLEGPILGRGYINDPEKTAAAWIEPPEWLVKFRGKSPGRVYKCGDLVRYIDNGEFQFVARKDFQVKLRGQRIELGEVESHLHTSFPGAVDAVVEIVTPEGEGRQPMLVAFVCWNPSGSKNEHKESDSLTEGLFIKPNREFALQAQMAESQMSKSLPVYMVPVVYLPLLYVPLTGNGKLDRKRLRAAAERLTPEQLEQYNSSTVPNQMPSTESEMLLQRIWARVLNKDAASIGIHNNFFRLGGDSISAMQVTSRCSAAGVSVTVADIFRHKTISQLAAVLQKSLAYDHPPEQFGTAFDLSPIQNVYFEAAPLGNHHFNQSFFLRITRPISASLLSDAIHRLVQLHSMLRARFSRDENGNWVQTVVDDVSGSYSYNQHHVPAIDAVDEIISSSELTIDVQKGPILTADMITIGNHDQYLFIAAHHLVTDLVSWRIILEDLEEYLNAGSISRRQSLSFQSWCTLQKKYAAENLNPDQSRLDRNMPAPPEDYWGTAGKSNLVKDTTQASFTLDGDITKALFESANQAFQTQPVELFQAALVHSFAQTFIDRPPPALWNEGHGREPWASQIDISGTVGWFTTMWPMYVPADGHNIFDVIRRTKDQRRAVPSNGWAHFASSLHPKAQSQPKSGDVKEVTFNFFGRYQQLERSDSLFQSRTRPETRVSDVSNELGRFSIIDVVAEMREQRLHFGFHFNRHAASNRPIVNWIERFEESLVDIARKLPLNPPSLTLSDFPLMSFTYQSLDKFLNNCMVKNAIKIDNIQDIYPCSPIQRGILLSQARSAQHYQTLVIWKMHANDSRSVNIERVLAAWRSIVARHPIFRTMFVQSIGSDSFVDQVVLKNVPAEVTILTSDEEDRLLNRLEKERKLTADSKLLPYRMTIGQTLAGDVLCGLEISHALFDGTTKQNLLREFAQAYDDGALPSTPGPSYHDYISYLQRQSSSSQEKYWTKYLDGVIPCLFPAIAPSGAKPSKDTLGSIQVDVGDVSAIRQFCEVNELTLSNVFQVAWGLVLKSYINSDAVCFGYLSAGRDVPVPQAQEAMGPFINILVCRMDLQDSNSLSGILHDNQNAFVETLKYQHYPLTDIIRAAEVPGGGSLFNTAMSLQNVSYGAAEEQGSVRLDVIGGEDPSEYDITIHIVVGSSRIEVALEYWQSFITEEIANGIADSLRQTIQEVVTKPDASVGGISMLGEQSCQILHKWSGKLPSPELSLVHDLIHQRCVAQPNAPAVDSWDGGFTYLEVDELSSKLASHLAQFDIGPDKFIPVCFEKSRWTTVVMLAIMKTGSAFVLLDPEQPEQRLSEICQSAQASVVVASERQTSMAVGFADHVVTVATESPVWTETVTRRLPVSSPDNILYGVFTSGSTGKPKGVMIEHRAFATSAREHSVALTINQKSRVLQFASYAFDASIAENLTTLLMGGCICVASDIERKQSLAQAVARMQANWIFTTPSMARILDPESFPSVRTMICGGELISDKELSMWRDEVDLYLAYGPTECAVFCGATSRVTADVSGRNLGTTFGCRSWVVDPKNHERLVPLGAVGELVLEGPIVARGYLREPDKTRAVFIQQPTWLKDYGGPPSKLYKTGDLVKYSADSTLHYISRKDTQVKLRGQRMELGEVEHRVRQCYPHSTDAIVELVIFGDQSRRPALVAFIYTESKSTTESQMILGQPSAEFHLKAQEAEASLNEQLPSYMVPTVYLPLQSLPLSTNGKANRRLLRECVEMLSQDELQAYCAPLATKTQPSNDTEQTLQTIWARVLNIAPEHIGMQDSFFRLGGDSISAMQVVGHCANQQLELKISDIFRYKTISSISQRTTTPRASVYGTEVRTETPFALSPIQQMFFDSAPDGINHFNQSFLFRINRATESQELLQALMALVTRHHMLRARFAKMARGDDDVTTWKQIIPVVTEDCFGFRDHQINSLEESKEIVRATHTSLNIISGPVFAADLIKTKSGARFIFVAAHHLVVDLVSWRIIIRDLEEMLIAGSIQSQPSLPFQTWTHLQAEYAVKQLSPESSFTGDTPPPMLDYWGVTGNSNLVQDAIDKEFVLNEETTRALFGSANEPFQTQPVELFQAALLHSFMSTFKDRSEAPTIFSEGHGREAWDSTIDLTSTVGWFTTMAPTYIQSHDLLDIVRKTKDQRRQLRNNGWAYFTSRYLNPDGRRAFQFDGPVEILFNFTGLYQQLERTDSLFSTVDDFHHGILDIAEDSPRLAIFDVTATAFDNRLRFSFFYNRHAGDARPVDQWITNYEKSLLELASILPSHENTSTLIDFPLMSFDYETLDTFTQLLPGYGVSASDIEDVYPCSPIQNGMLLSQSRATLIYDNRFTLKITSELPSSGVSPTDFITTWSRVVERHSILRTFFIPSQTGTAYMDQVVLRGLPEGMVTVLPRASHPLQTLDNLPSFEPTKGLPPYHLTLCNSSTDELFCLFEINHALLDGTSLQVLVRDLHRAFDELLPARPGLLYGDYIAYIQSLPVDTAKEYWKQYLSGSDPCLFPTSHKSSIRKMRAATTKVESAKKLREMCETHGITLSNIFQLAWSLVLRAFTGSDDICFGYLTSGRDIPLSGIEDAIGPFINMLVCRTKFSSDLTLGQLLESTQEDYINNTKHQHVSLAEIKRSLNLPDIPLFNTILSLQRGGMAMGATEASSVRIEPLKGEDPTEVRTRNTLLVNA